MTSAANNPDLAALEQDMAAVRLLANLDAEHDVDGPPTSGPLSLDQLRLSIDGAIARDTGAIAQLRSLSVAQRLLLVVALATAITAAIMLTGPTDNLSGTGMWRAGVVMLVVAVMTVLTCWRLLRPLHLPPANRWVGYGLVAVGVLLPFLMAWALRHDGGQAAATGSAFFKQCAVCTTFGAVLGLPVLGLALLLRRAKIDGVAVGALAGIAAGFTGFLTLHLHCTISDPIHVMGGHASVLLVLGGAAALWRWREYQKTSDVSG